MGGAVPTTAWQGLLSGLGHPVIEINHLLFLLGAATVVGLLKFAPVRAALALMLYAAASAVSTAVRVSGLELVLAEPMVAMSLLVLALCIWLRRAPSGAAGGLMAGTSGLIHGYAYGEAVVGAELTPLAWYVGGLFTIQTLLLVAVFAVVRWLRAVAPTGLVTAKRALGVAIGAAGSWALWASLRA
jgi:urease accessory protein